MKAKNVVLLVLALLGSVASGCSTTNLVALPQNVTADAKTANDLFIKYGDAAEAKCAAFFNTLIASQDAKSASLEALKAEATNGLISKAAVAILIAQILRSQGADAATQFRAGFNTNCGEVQGEVLALIMSRGLSTK